MDVTSSQKVVGYSHKICAAITWVSLSFSASCFCISQDSQLGKTDNYVSLLVVYIEPHSDIQIIQSEWYFQVSTRVILNSLWIRYFISAAIRCCHQILENNHDQPQYNILFQLTNTVKKSSPYQALGFLFVSQWCSL